MDGWHVFFHRQTLQITLTALIRREGISIATYLEKCPASMSICLCRGSSRAPLSAIFILIVLDMPCCTSD